jgi:hypothetical protein
MQQGWFLPPQLPQLPEPAQVPAPQDWPVPTQAGALVPMRPQQPELQRLPGQHGPPLTPQVLQSEPLPEAVQTVPASVQGVELEQQGVSFFPQTHWPLVQRPPGYEVHRPPLAVHRPLVQQPPSRQLLPGVQHGPPGRPHTVQRLLLVSQTASPSLHL